VDRAEQIAEAFHDAYERLAPEYGYETREASRKPWSEVPENNRELMAAVVSELLENGIIAVPMY
jgi:isopentenyl phosphate kinase